MGNYWDCISAIATAFGAIATSCACLIALYQTRLTMKSKVEVKCTDNLCIYQVRSEVNDDKRYLRVTVNNIGNRITKITGVGYKNRLREGFAFINPCYASDEVITPGAEHRLNPGDSFSFLLEREHLRKYLVEEKKNERKRLRIFVCDNMLHAEYARIPKSLFKS